MFKSTARFGAFFARCIALLSALFGMLILVNTLRLLPAMVDLSSKSTALPTLLVYGLLLFPLLMTLYRLLVKYHIHEKPAAKWLILLLIVAGQTALLLALQPVPYWDEVNTAEAAAKMLTEASPQMPSLKGYFAYYGNNYAFVIVEYLYYRLLSLFGVTDFWAWTLAANLLFLDAGLMLLSRFLNRLRGSKASFAFLYICLFNPYSYLCAGFAYTTVLSIFLIAVELMLLLRLRLALQGAAGLPRIPGEKTGRAAAAFSELAPAAAFGAVTVIGAMIRVVTLIPLIAAAICALIRRLVCGGGRAPRPSKKRRFRVFSGALVAALCCFFCSTAVINHFVPQEMRAQNFPFTHWIMMSFNPDIRGTYSAEDERLTAEAPAGERVAVNLSVLRQRISDMSASQLARLLNNKLTETWSACWRYIQPSILSSRHYGFVYHCLTGDSNAAFRGWFQLSLAALYLLFTLTALGCLRSARPSLLKLFLLLSVLGGIIFYLIWEVSGLYSICFLPFAAMIAALWMARRCDSANGLHYWLYAFCLITVLRIVPLRYRGGSLNYYSSAYGWSVNSTLRRRDLEFRVSDVSDAGHELRQSFSVRRNFSFNRIELLAAPLGPTGAYCFELFDENGAQLYAQLILPGSLSASDDAEDGAYLTIVLPQKYGEGKYFFTLTGTDSTVGANEELYAFICRQSYLSNANAQGCLLIDGREPAQGPGNLVFNVY